MRCVKFHELRVRYLPKNVYTRPSMFKFLSLIDSKDQFMLKKLGLFIHFAFNKYTADELLA